MWWDERCLEARGSLAGADPAHRDINQRINAQVEFYFSDANLPSDEFLLSQLRSYSGQYVPISVIAGFNRVKKISKSVFHIAHALRFSEVLEVDSTGRFVRRREPYKEVSIKEVYKRSVIAERVPVDDLSPEAVHDFFASKGFTPRHVRIGGKDNSQKKASNVKNLNKSKLPHAIVEFADEAQAMEVLSSALNEETNWKNKNAMRLFPLLKNKEKGNKSKEKETKPKDISPAAAPEERPARLQFSRHKAASSTSAAAGAAGAGEAPPSHLPQKQSQDNATSDAQLSNASPRMPDGTRGFTMGRGRRIDPKAPTAGVMCT